MIMGLLLTVFVASIPNLSHQAATPDGNLGSNLVCELPHAAKTRIPPAAKAVVQLCQACVALCPHDFPTDRCVIAAMNLRPSRQF